jgi:hypothetical protein
MKKKIAASVTQSERGRPPFQNHDVIGVPKGTAEQPLPPVAPQEVVGQWREAVGNIKRDHTAPPSIGSRWLSTIRREPTVGKQRIEIGRDSQRWHVKR